MVRSRVPRRVYDSAFSGMKCRVEYVVSQCLLCKVQRSLVLKALRNVLLPFTTGVARLCNGFAGEGARVWTGTWTIQRRGQNTHVLGGHQIATTSISCFHSSWNRGFSARGVVSRNKALCCGQCTLVLFQDHKLSLLAICLGTGRWWYCTVAPVPSNSTY